MNTYVKISSNFALNITTLTSIMSVKIVESELSCDNVVLIVQRLHVETVHKELQY